jgi:hypothetical protein
MNKTTLCKVISSENSILAQKPDKDMHMAGNLNLPNGSKVRNPTTPITNNTVKGSDGINPLSSQNLIIHFSTHGDEMQQVAKAHPIYPSFEH